MRNSASIKHIVLSVLFVIASINFTKTTLEIIKSSKRLDNVKDEVTSLDQQKRQMQLALDYKKTDAYVEEKARNDLNMIKPGEKVYVVVGGDSQEKSGSVLGAFTSKTVVGVSNSLKWQQNLRGWYELFF